MEQVKYILANLLNLPLFPILYFQGKHIRKTIPRLPEAKQPYGSTGTGAQKIKLISIGESTIAGVGVATHAQGFTGHLAQAIAQATSSTVDWQVTARSGYTARKVKDKLLPKISASSFDMIIIGLGGNDTFKLNSPKQWRRDIESLIDKLQVQFPDTPVVFCNVPPIRSFPAFTPVIKFVLGRQIDLLHEVLKKVVASKEGIWYIEKRIKLEYWLEHFKEKAYTPQDFFSDGVHPSELTYKTWANETAKFVLEKEII